MAGLFQSQIKQVRRGPAKELAVSDLRLQNIFHHAEQLIGPPGPVGAVDILEPVNVERNQGNVLPAGAARIQQFSKLRLVVCAGHSVIHGHMKQPVLRQQLLILKPSVSQDDSQGGDQRHENSGDANEQEAVGCDPFQRRVFHRITGVTIQHSLAALVTD